MRVRCAVCGIVVDAKHTGEPRSHGRKNQRCRGRKEPGLPVVDLLSVADLHNISAHACMKLLFDAGATYGGGVHPANKKPLSIRRHDLVLFGIAARHSLNWTPWTIPVEFAFFWFNVPFDVVARHELEDPQPKIPLARAFEIDRVMREEMARLRAAFGDDAKKLEAELDRLMRVKVGPGTAPGAGEPEGP